MVASTDEAQFFFSYHCHSAGDIQPAPSGYGQGAYNKVVVGSLASYRRQQMKTNDNPTH